MNQILQRVRQYHQQTIQLCPKPIQCVLNQEHVLGHEPQERLRLCGNAIADQRNKKGDHPQKQ